MDDKSASGADPVPALQMRYFQLYTLSQLGIKLKHVGSTFGLS
ncbi:MAG TPA: hypothetical protein VIK56_07455 [Rhodoferax sp.]